MKNLSQDCFQPYISNVISSSISVQSNVYYFSYVLVSQYNSVEMQTRIWYFCNAVVTIAIQLRYDYDPTMTYRARLLPIWRKQKMNMSIFRRIHVF